MDASPIDLAAWRAVTGQRFEGFLDGLYEGLRKYYTIPKPDPTRPLVEQHLREVLDGLFDPAQYPDGMDAEAVMMKAEAELGPQLKMRLEPLWMQTKLEGKRNHYKNARSFSWTYVGEECYARSDQLIGLMRDEAATLMQEERQRAILPRGVAHLRAHCLQAGAAVIDAILAQLATAYAIPDEARTTLHEALGTALGQAFAEAGTLARRPLVEHVLQEGFASGLASACAEKGIELRSTRPWIARKELAPVIALPRVQTELRHAVAECINAEFREASAAPTAQPAASLEAASIMHQGVIDYRTVPFLWGHDRLCRVQTAQQRFDVMIAGDKRLEPLRESIHQALAHIDPPRSKTKVATDYFTWLEKHSGKALEAKLAEIGDLAKAERDLLMETYKAALPSMLEEAHGCADFVAANWRPRSADR